MLSDCNVWPERTSSRTFANAFSDATWLEALLVYDALLAILSAPRVKFDDAGERCTSTAAEIGLGYPHQILAAASLPRAAG
jgi:hypothetical protein